ncbi:MAG: nicotinate (nicotinamide) nucleotide adenylyltransferase [Elusimicrobia bacterium]|nr:nicotinate (nicotinamide) nucleotide adenylyltransferase [Elusimicrobiota bacterium]
MKKIAIFGGSFDPVHLAHIRLAETAAEEFALDEVVFVPAYIAPHKTYPPVSAAHRLQMLRFALKDKNKFSLSLFEIEQLKPIYTYQTLNYFQGLYKNSKVYLLAGADSFNDFPNWKNIDDILNNYSVIIARRPNAQVNKSLSYYGKVFFTSNQMPDISSTTIRNTVKISPENLSILTGKAVADYILENKLYQ